MAKKYKKNFLNKVIARVDFASPLPGVAEALPSEISEIALKHFPIDEPKKLQRGRIEFKEGGAVSAEKLGTQIEWRYHGKSREKSMCITPDFMWIVHNHYESFKSFKSDILPILNVLFSVYGKDKQIVIKRFGLRYINNIHLDESDPTEWSQYIKSDLLAIFDISDEKDSICRSLQNLELNFGNMNLKFQFGMHNPDYPAPIRSKDFILDYDAYLQGLQDESIIIQNIELFHDKIKTFFESHIKQKLRKVMNDE